MMMDDNYNVKLIDFGDARKVDEDPNDLEEQDTNMGPRFTFVGTVNY